MQIFTLHLFTSLLLLRCLRISLPLLALLVVERSGGDSGSEVRLPLNHIFRAEGGERLYIREQASSDRRHHHFLVVRDLNVTISVPIVALRREHLALLVSRDFSSTRVKLFFALFLRYHNPHFTMNSAPPPSSFDKDLYVRMICSKIASPDMI